ncbi:hypothetical protein ABFX02_08G162900 [Erythranthe guttata]
MILLYIYFPEEKIDHFLSSKHSRSRFYSLSLYISLSLDSSVTYLIMDNQQEDKSSSPQTITTDHGGADSKEQNPTTSSPPKTEAAAAVEFETTRAVAAADETPAAASPPLDGNAATAFVDLAETLKEDSPAVAATGKRGREESSNTGEAANELVELPNAPLPPGPLLLSPDHENTTTEEDSRSGDSNYSSPPVSRNSSDQSTANDKNLIKKTKREQSPDEIEEGGSGFSDGSGFSAGSS